MTRFEHKVKVYGPRFKQDLGLTDEQVAGIFGNFAVETGKFQHMQELNPTVAGSKGGWGWAQWTGMGRNGRRKAFMDWTEQHNLSPESDEANYGFAVHELRTSEAKALMQLKKTTTAEAAAETFMLYYERPGIPHLNSRKKYAAEALKYLKDQKTPAVIHNAENATAGSIILTGGTWAISLAQSKPLQALAIIAISAGLAGLGWFIVNKIKNRKTDV